jgi:hypothetical protein
MTNVAVWKAVGGAREWAIVNLELHEYFTPKAFDHPNSLTGVLTVNKIGPYSFVGVPSALVLLLASFPEQRGGGDPQAGGNPSLCIALLNHALSMLTMTLRVLSRNRCTSTRYFG